MRIALMGYGNMGKTIEKIALERGHQIVLKYSLEDIPENWMDLLREADVAIEFTSPDAAVNNILKCFEADTPVVVGTTGWYDQFQMISALVKDQNKALFYATNFSVGVNLFFELNKWLAKKMNTHPEYRISMEEIHHIHKKDAPSGTAITLAEGILENNSMYKGWENTKDATADNIPVFSVREDEVPGTHIIRFTSEIDQIEIKHTAYSRHGFALGSVLAAEFLNGKKGIFTMSDMLKNS